MFAEEASFDVSSNKFAQKRRSLRLSFKTDLLKKINFPIWLGMDPENRLKERFNLSASKYHTNTMGDEQSILKQHTNNIFGAYREPKPSRRSRSEYYL